ncbi:MAG: class I SAM-dependent methyltransferase [Beduini sp.]
MHNITEIPAWDRLLKRIVWKQLGKIEGKRILDFGSGEGINANHYAKNNEVIAIEPMEEMLNHRWQDFDYKQIKGDEKALTQLPDCYFDVIICHNVLEYIDCKADIINQFYRLLKPNGKLSLVKHNKAGRVMQMAVLLDDIDKATALLNGENSRSKKYGAIKYYDDEMISKWNSGLKLVHTYGIRTFFDLQQNQENHQTEQWQLKMMELEMKVSTIDIYQQIAFFHHLIYTK